MFDVTAHSETQNQWLLAIVTVAGQTARVEARCGKRATPQIAVVDATKPGEFWMKVNRSRIRSVVQSDIEYDPGDSSLRACVEAEVQVVGLETPLKRAFAIKVKGTGPRARGYALGAVTDQILTAARNGMYKALRDSGWRPRNGQSAAEPGEEEIPDEIASIQF